MLTSEDPYSDDLGENDTETVEDNDGNELIREIEEQNEDDPTKIKPIKAKRIVRNPRPKLNEDTLKGPRGLTALPSYFERVKFKRKDHEEEDLNVLLKTYEYWCHRLFPKLPFDDCLAKIEKLGTKRAVQTHLKRIRMDLEPPEPSTIIENNDRELFENDGCMDIPTSVGISEAQEERIRLNRERARKLRDDRLKANEQQNRGLEGEFSQVMDTEIVGAQTNDTIRDQINTDSELEERIRLNRERAKKLREERLKAQKCVGGQIEGEFAQEMAEIVDNQKSVDESFNNKYEIIEGKLKAIQQPNRELDDYQISELEGEFSQEIADKETAESNDGDEETIDNILDQINADDA